MKFYKDPLVRRFVSASVFAAAFIWVAVRYFDVDTEVIWVLFVFSVAFVIGMMVLGFVFSFVLRWLRRGDDGMLSRLEDTTREDE